jgi:hypothetical protein
MEDEPKERVKFSKSEREQRAIEAKEAAALDSRLRREHRDQKTARLRALRLAKEECDANARALAKT